MPELEIHKSGDRFVLNSDIGSFLVLLSLARQMHRPEREPDEHPDWLVDLAETLSRISRQLPSQRSYPNLETLVAEQDIPGVDFISYTARVVLGLEASVLRRIGDCLEMVVLDGDDSDLHTLTGAFFPEIRSMYLTVLGATGEFERAHRTALPEGWVALRRQPRRSLVDRMSAAAGALPASPGCRSPVDTMSS